MKRLLLTVPLILLLLVNACGNDPAANISDAQWAIVRQTETAAAWTATPVATFNPNIPIMVNWLNGDLSSMTNSLEATMDVKYSVTNISFPNGPNSSDLIFQVNVGCICMNSDNCCIPERTFVVIVEAMKRNSITNPVQVPDGVDRMMVVCSDSQTKSLIGAISALWQDVQDYLQGRVSGYQLGARVTRTIAP
ncbi:MAG TPA: hypothetical protein VK206_12320 [Anaerolineales bacterium]|nr:hypothetical protein [Anaerolineales bacterium]HLO33301.1 hypothetical protein [Anaerolineales bacterium]